jgi:hypothetical protein
MSAVDATTLASVLLAPRDPHLSHVSASYTGVAAASGVVALESDHYLSSTGYSKPFKKVTRWNGS